uniref:Uncharacterized protein n=1 Tax=Batrachochytrium dendrobatidis (strain JAM81 / FGSC 10211) TaxID=684364 RepID=F4PFM0_BATDJ|eukprot:XP_006683405.1 hypothetical protein BATDEDRAFT_28917 [Batrachochytrium dendrobatidis JAM81]
MTAFIGAVAGIGGGVILVPSLFFMQSISDTFSWATPQAIVGISLVTMIFTGLSSTLAYVKGKRIDYRTGLLFLIGSIPGGIVGSWLNQFINADVFLLYFGILMIVISLLMFIKRDRFTTRLDPASNGMRTFTLQGITYQYRVPVLSAIILSLCVGILSGLFGIGGGSIIVPAMILLFGVPAHIATATSMFMIFFWPRVAGFLENAKSTRKEHGDSYWIFDIGDHVDRVHPISEASMGRANIKLMNELGYDLVTLGNNEGITLSHDDLYHLYDQADFDVVCSNLHTMDEQEPDWLKRMKVIQTDSGVKIGVIGLTAPFNDYYDLLNWHVSPQYEALDKYVKVLKKSTDIIILLSHLGISEDQEIARRYEDIDLIIGGHTHHLLRTGENINQTLITAAGKHSLFIGEVILTWDHDKHRLVQKEAYATDITGVPKDLMTEQTLFQMQMKADQQLEKPIVYLEEPIEVKWFQDTAIVKELTNTLKEWTMADCAMLNAGLLLDQLPAGNITYGDVHRICPHPINPVVVELRGNELLEVIRAAFTKDFMELKLKGFGFRGEVLEE